MKTVKAAEVKIGKYRLVEKDCFENGQFVDTICQIYIGRIKGGVYCSISDAMAHKCEWMEE